METILFICWGFSIWSGMFFSAKGEVFTSLVGAVVATLILYALLAR